VKGRKIKILVEQFQKYYDLKKEMGEEARNFLPEKLTKTEEKFICLYLDSQGVPRYEIADIINRCTDTVSARINQAKEEIGSAITEKDLNYWIGDLKESATTVIRKLLQIKDYKEAWKVKKELFEKLQSIGLIPEKAKQIQIFDMAEEMKSLEVGENEKNPS
jgi:hypothetical protein